MLDISGVHEVETRFCACTESSRIDDWQQMYRTGWYPATSAQPQTCATLEVLGFYRLLKVVANCSVRDFVSVLEALTNPLGTSPPPPRYKVRFASYSADSLSNLVCRNFCGWLGKRRASNVFEEQGSSIWTGCWPARPMVQSRWSAGRVRGRASTYPPGRTNWHLSYSRSNPSTNYTVR